MPDKIALPPGATLVDDMKLPPGAVMVDDQPVSTPDFSAPANNSEGLYEMSSPDGTRQVPFSKVKDALGAGYSMKHALLMKYRDDFRATQPSWFQTATEPTVPKQGMTTSEALQSALGDGPTNVLKRAARFVGGVAQMPAQLTSIVTRLYSSDPKVSSDAEGELLELHPGAQADSRIKEAIADWRKSPTLATENVVGDALGVYVTGKTVEGVSKAPHAVADTARNVGEAAAGVSPRETAALVKKTQAKNTRIEDINTKRSESDTARVQAVEAQNAETLRASRVKADADRAAQLRDYLRKKQTVNEANSARQSVADRKVALERGVEHLDPELKIELENTRDAVNAEANAKYAELSAKLDPMEADPETMAEALDTSLEAIKGSNTKPPILEDIRKRIQNGTDALTYRDLQGYRSELGRELSKGSLAGDVFHAYKGLQESITDEMERIADRNDMHAQFASARDYYRRYAQTFIDKKSPVRKALASPERGGVVKSLIGKDQSGIESIAQFNPELSRRLNTVRGHAEEASSLRASSAPPKPEPTLPPKPEFIPPKLKPVPEPRRPLQKKTVGPDEIQAAKEAGLRKNAAMIRHRGTSIAIYVTGYRSLAAIARAAMGDAHALSQLPMDVGEGVAVVGGAHAVASMLESPRAIELLTKPNARDIAQIPPELRSGLKPVIEQAQKHGIKVSPLLIAAVMGDAAEGPQTKRLRELRNQLHPHP